MTALSPDDEDTIPERPVSGRRTIAVTDWGAATSTGAVRPTNEDAWGRNHHLYVVADGMGGTGGGDLAGRLAVDAMLAEDLRDGPIDIVRKVNGLVRTKTRDLGLPGAGTTLVATLVEPMRLMTINVGDSRIYRYRGSALCLLSTDHNIANLRIEEGLDPDEPDERGRPRALTSYIGNPDPNQRIDVGTVSAENGDRFVLCTDGVHNQVGLELMQRLLARQTCLETAESLVDAADAAGGRDNATALVIEISEVFE